MSGFTRIGSERHAYAYVNMDDILSISIRKEATGWTDIRLAYSALDSYTISVPMDVDEVAKLIGWKTES
jgi:hypothetical protein